MTTTVNPTPAIESTRPSRRVRLGVAGVIVLVVIGVVVWLLWPSPPGSLELHSGTAGHLVTATVDRTRLGSTDVHLDITDRAGKPVTAGRIQVEAVDPRMGYAGMPVEAASTAPGHFHAVGVEFMMTGPWQLHVFIDDPGGADQLVLPLWISG